MTDLRNKKIKNFKFFKKDLRLKLRVIIKIRSKLCTK